MDNDTKKYPETRRRIIRFRVLASNELSPIESESGPSFLQGFRNNFLCLMSLSRKFVTTSLVRFEGLDQGFS